MPFAYQDLTDPERELADAVRDGTICVFPEPTEIRGEVIHDLFLGLIEGYEPTHQGLRFAGLPAEKGKSRCLTITGTLDLDYARADHGGALPRLAILNAVFENSFDMVGAHLAEVNLTGCRLHGLRGEQARIDRHFLFIGVETQAPVFLSAAFIEGQFSANGAAFSNPNDVALNFQDATIKGGVVLREANFTGAVVANTLSTEGQFSANGATFSNPNGDALNLQGATVKDGVFLEKANCTGTVEAKGLSTEGQFSANGATFSNPDGIALDLQGATIKNGVFLDAANFTGAVNANTLSTEGQFSANGVTFLNPDGIALILQGATVKGGLFLRKSGGTRATFLGTLDANNALLEYVLAEGAILQGPGNQPAMDFRNASILQDLLLIGAQITGGLALDHATIGARMTITRAIFTPDGHQTCLSLRRATINGTLETLYFASPPTGIFDLTGADIHTIEDHAFRGWPNDGGLILDGLTYRRIGFPGVPKGAPAYLFRDILDKNGPDALFERRRQWLMRQYRYGEITDDFKPQPYRQLIRVLRDQGQHGAARKMAIELREIETLKMKPWSFGRILSSFLGLISRYGYSPGCAFSWFIGWWAMGTFAVWQTMNNDMEDGFGGYTHALTVKGEYQIPPETFHLEAWSYALDLIVPLVEFGQNETYQLVRRCAPEETRKTLGYSFCNWPEFLESLYSLGGFALFSILILTLTGVLRQDGTTD